MIEVRDLTKKYGPVIAVDRVTFEVKAGEIVGYLGPNGAGKTTSMRILTTFIPATSGTVSVAGFDVMNQSEDVRRNIGYLPESVPLYPEMRVEEYLLFRAKIKGVERQGRQKRLDYCMDRCRVREVRRRLMGTLSRGYRQRVGLADSMIHDPKILILDEPTSGLDPVQQEETLSLIKELGDKHTILLSTHHLHEVEAVCSRVIIINAGRLSLDKTMSELAAIAPTVVVEVRGPQDKVTACFQGLEGVRGVRVLGQDDGYATYEIETANDIREVVFKQIVSHAWSARKLDLARRSLEEHFKEVVIGRKGRRPANPFVKTETAPVVPQA